MSFPLQSLCVGALKYSKSLRHFSTNIEIEQRKILGRYYTTPIQLFRLQSQKDVRLRIKSPQTKKIESYDIIVHPDGKVHPTPLNNDMWMGKN